MKKRIDPIDIHVGARVRLRRSLCGLSQESVGESLGLTFQQIQKYEKGANRIGSSNLYRLSVILDVPISFFVDGLNTPGTQNKTDGAHKIDKGGLLFLRDFAKLTSEQKKSCPRGQDFHHLFFIVMKYLSMYCYPNFSNTSITSRT